MKLVNHLSVAAVLVVSTGLFHVACSPTNSHCNKNNSTDVKTQRFFENTLLVKKGMTQIQAETIMGKPDIVITSDESKILSRCDSDKVHLYYHPVYATVHFIFGIKDGQVTRVTFWREWGTRLPIEGELVDVLEFWTQETCVHVEAG